jgi:alkaline phosphatase D
MTRTDRRRFVLSAAALGAAAAWRAKAAPSRIAWTERRDLYPQGVASGDPGPDSVILWTRRPAEGAHVSLTLELAEDPEFRRVVATTRTEASAALGWTTRVLAGGLAPSTEYFYRFTDDEGHGSRVGRTLTAPAPDDPRPVRFTFVSCQNVQEGAQNAYRRMIFEDERAAPGERLDFVLHLGDFIYEVVQYADERATRYDRTIRDILRFRNERKVAGFHVPVDVEGYRQVYCAYLLDPEIQDARARWPFVAMGDNHEFSWQGWQSIAVFAGGSVPAQSIRVAANQAWFEFQPARVAKPGAGLNTFDAPRVVDAPITAFDAHGLGAEPNNLAALGSLTAYRALRFGRHLDLILTDLHSYRSEEPTGRKETDPLSPPPFSSFFPEDAQKVLDAGRTANGGRPPTTIRFGDTEIANFRRDTPAQTILGAVQKAWFLKRLKASKATWKVWGATAGVLDRRADLQNLPEGFPKWPGEGYAGFGGGDHGSAYVERGEIYDFIQREKITGFAAVSGDRHSFWAGRPAKALPPERFEPVGVAFITGSISAPGMAEALEHTLPKTHPLRPLFLADRPDGGRPDTAANMLMRHGVRTCIEYSRSRDLAKARALRNPENAPHLDFLDVGGHGYAHVTVTAKAMTCDFVCIPRPIKRSEAPDGGPLRYRVRHEAAIWAPGAEPQLVQTVLEGDPGLSI